MQPINLESRLKQLEMLTGYGSSPMNVKTYFLVRSVFEIYELRRIISQSCQSNATGADSGWISFNINTSRFTAGKRFF